MARKRITEQALGSWEEVNAALKKIGEAQLEIDLIETDMNASISAVKEEAKEKVKKHEEDIKLQELMIQQYVTEHKDELKGKSLKLALDAMWAWSAGYQKQNRAKEDADQS